MHLDRATRRRSRLGSSSCQASIPARTCSYLLGTVFSALSNAAEMVLRQRASIIGLSVFLLLPLTFLSSAFMAPDLMPGWMQTVAG